MNTIPGAGPGGNSSRAGYCMCSPKRRKLFIPTAAPTWCMACGSDIDPHENEDSEPETGREAVLPPAPTEPKGHLP